MNAPTSPPKVQRNFSTSILLWVRNDQPRATGMAYWKGPHAKIIAASKGMKEYRQLHLAERNPGLWPATDGVETSIPPDRKVDGVAEVTFESTLSSMFGYKQTQLAFKDEINVFRRTLLYAGPPGTSRWYEVGTGAKPGARFLVYLRRREGVKAGDFRSFVTKQFTPAIASAVALEELRTQCFLPWSQKLWDTPNVAHDNPPDQRFHASIILGFADAKARNAFLAGKEIEALSRMAAC